MNRTAKILLIDDDPGTASSLQSVLEGDGYRVATIAHGGEGLECAKQKPFDLVITDLRMPGINGLDLVRQLHQAKPRLPIILMTAFGTTETAIEATKCGAYDYLVKPFDMQELLDLADKAVSISQLMSEPVDMGQAAAGHDAIIGESRAMQEVYKEIGRVAASDVSVLILGETGTGKELVARAIYQHSQRADKPFIAINCTAIPETLLESELFGHERGTFTGADTRRIGRFEQAHGGTIFLDEIGDLNASTQSKLLRVLQERIIERLGGQEEIPIDVRVIAATHRELEEAIREKQFREDLFYRLNTYTIHLPPLRDRSEDIPALTNYFLCRYGKDLGLLSPSIETEAIQFLREQAWPGNIRELQNVVRQALLVSRARTIGLETVQDLTSKTAVEKDEPAKSLAAFVQETLDAAKSGKIENAYAVILEAVEKEIFKRAIRLSDGNQARAAGWLGLSRLTMREKLHRFGLHPSQAKPPAAGDPER